ncbi:MAG: aminopeptidase [Desulfobacteraceae bacterium]|nr:aminopeptidase [Desulfobacteraceae bacterium]
MVTKRIIGITLILILFGSGCRLTYLLHAAAGQFHVLRGSIPVEEALHSDYLRPEQKGLLRLVAKIKEFGENELGLKKTQNYQEIYLTSHRYHIYSVSASPKDRLSRMTWWFPVVGKMPYLGFFDLESAREEKENLVKKNLDVTMGIADAYSTLGWFRDPVTMNMIQRSPVYLAETILHEITHATFYLQGQSEFNEGLAVLVGKRGALHFLETTYGSSHPLTMQARKAVEDERIFSSFLASLLDELERLYDSPIGYEEKLSQREEVFSRSLEEFARLKNRLQTKRFINFDNVELNNAYLLSIGLYHRNFHLFEAVLNETGDSIRETLTFFQGLAKEEGDLLENTRKWLGRQKRVN